MRWIERMLVLAALAAAFAPGAAAQAVVSSWQEPVPSVPASLDGAEREPVEQARRALVAEQQALDGAVTSLNADCGHVRSDETAKLAECRRRQQALVARIEAFVTRRDAFA